MRLGLAIIDAGAASRLGRTRALLPWNGTTLIRAIVAMALRARLGPVAVVLGAEAVRIATELRRDPVDLIDNPTYGRGPGTSIWAATRWAIDGGCDGLLLARGDQPFVEADDLRRLAGVAEDGAGLAGTRYDDGPGVPALVTRRFFPQLLGLRADQGARALLRSLTGLVRTVAMPHALAGFGAPADHPALAPHGPGD